MTYLIIKGGYTKATGNVKPQIVEEKEFANIIEAKKYCKGLGKEYWCEAKTRNAVMLNDYTERLKSFKN